MYEPGRNGDEYFASAFLSIVSEHADLGSDTLGSYSAGIKNFLSIEEDNS